MRSVTRNPPGFFPPRLLAGMGLHAKLCCTYCPCGVLARDWRKAKGLRAAAQPRCFGQHDKAAPGTWWLCCQGPAWPGGVEAEGKCKNRAGKVGFRNLGGDPHKLLRRGQLLLCMWC